MLFQLLKFGYRVAHPIERHSVCRTFQSLLCAVCIEALVGCGGNQNAPNLPVPTQVNGATATAETQATSPANTMPVEVNLTYKLPLVTQSKSSRRLQYISNSNTQLTVTVTPFGSSPATYGPSACTNSTSCVVSFTAVPGPTTLGFLLTDGSGTVLSSFKTTVIIQPSTLNTLNFTANPVVNSVVLNLASTMVNGGSVANIPLTVTAFDADGNIIAGNASYVDANGNDVALILSVSNVQAGGKGTLALLGPSRITASGQSSVNAHYDGNWLAQATVSVTSTSPVITSFTPATLTINPYAIEYSTGIPAGSGPFNIINGLNGNLWFTEYNGSKIASITPSGTVTQYATGANPHYMVDGPDGNIWFTETTGSKVAHTTPSGGIVQYNIVPGTNPVKIIDGPDGNLWFITNNTPSYLQAVTPNGTFIHAYPLSGSFPRGVVLGPDGNFWVTYAASATLGRVTPTGIETDFTYTDTHLNYDSDTPTVGPDGNIWFADAGGYYICRYSFTTSSITVFSTGITAAAKIRTVTNGPDGNLWFAEVNNGGIGRITPSGTVTEFNVGAGFTAASSPIGIVTGPDGNLWVTEFSGQRIAKFVL